MHHEWILFMRFICDSFALPCFAFCVVRAGVALARHCAEWNLRKRLKDLNASSASSQLWFLRAPKMDERFKQFQLRTCLLSAGHTHWHDDHHRERLSFLSICCGSLRLAAFFPCLWNFWVCSAQEHMACLIIRACMISAGVAQVPLGACPIHDPVLLCFCVAMVKTQKSQHSWLQSRWVSRLKNSKKLSRWKQYLWFQLCSNRSLQHVQPSQWWFPPRAFLLWVSR